jgi:hypothetical protein
VRALAAAGCGFAPATSHPRAPFPYALKGLPTDTKLRITHPYGVDELSPSWPIDNPRLVAQ